MYFADLHIHSHYSMATSKACHPEGLTLWGSYKGIDLLGTGDLTHPGWRQELREKLEEAGDGFFRLRREFQTNDIERRVKIPGFVLSGEISTIYKKDGRTRKVHSLILLPSFEAAEKLSAALEKVGNIRSDGRPILGLDCKDLLAMTLDAASDAIFIPAHIWTPHFSLFGAKSGFDRIEDCFEDLAPEIFALETGLSSDPAMNSRLSALDRFTLVSNSDAHSPEKLGREANCFSGEFSYHGMREALRFPENGFEGTVEFYPEEGKYHWDGHRDCGVCWDPIQTRKAKGICPVCERPVTMGVLHRIDELADRREDHPWVGKRRFQRLVPLATVIQGFVGGGRKGRAVYMELIERFGSELATLKEAELSEVEKTAGAQIAESIRRVREGELEISPGYDGVYGKVRLGVAKA